MSVAGIWVARAVAPFRLAPCLTVAAVRRAGGVVWRLCAGVPGRFLPVQVGAGFGYRAASLRGLGRLADTGYGRSPLSVRIVSVFASRLATGRRGRFWGTAPFTSGRGAASARFCARGV